MPTDLLFTGSDFLLGAGIAGLYGYLYMIDKKMSASIEGLRILAVLHVKHHPEDLEQLKKCLEV